MTLFNMHTFRATRSLLAAFALTVLFVQCKKDDPEEINEEETITRVTLTLTDSNGASVPYTWNDGSAEPTINLTAGSVYQASIEFFDASDPNEVENITEEVIEEADEHLVFYEVASASISIASAANDITDSASAPTNLKTTWTVGDAATGTLRAYLIHEPTSKTGTTRNALGGSADVELSFPITIQ